MIKNVECPTSPTDRKTQQQHNNRLFKDAQLEQQIYLDTFVIGKGNQRRTRPPSSWLRNPAPSTIRSSSMEASVWEKPSDARHRPSDAATAATAKVKYVAAKHSPMISSIHPESDAGGNSAMNTAASTC
jgi:hypothetical protein